MPHVAGDALRPPLTAAQRDLAARHVRLARWHARQFIRRRHDLAHDYASAATFGVVVAAGRYDPAARVPFAAYARRAIRNRLGCVRKLDAPLGYRLSPDPRPGRVPYLDGDEQSGRVVGRAPVPPASRAVDSAESFEALLRRLPAPQAEACRLYYRDGLNDTEIARRLGITRAAATKRRQRALATLRGDPCPA